MVAGTRDERASAMPSNFTGDNLIQCAFNKITTRAPIAARVARLMLESYQNR